MVRNFDKILQSPRSFQHEISIFIKMDLRLDAGGEIITKMELRSVADGDIAKKNGAGAFCRQGLYLA